MPTATAEAPPRSASQALKPVQHVRDVYTPAQLARVLGKDPSAIVRWCKIGVGRRDGGREYMGGAKTPGGWLIPAGAVDAFFSALTADARRQAKAASIDHAEHAAADAACAALGL